MKTNKNMGFAVAFLLLLVVSGPLFSQERPLQNVVMIQSDQVLQLSVEKSINNMPGLKLFPGGIQHQKFEQQLKSWKIAPPAIKWKAASRWRSIKEIYILKHRVYNELIINKKRLNLA